MATQANQSLLACKYCTKQFKKQPMKEKHEYEQACIPASARTYCRVCDWTAESTTCYKSHLISRLHLNKLGRMNTDTINISNIITDPTQQKLQAFQALDPILSSYPQSDQNNVKIFFTDGSIAKVTVNGEALQDLSLSSQEKQIRDTESANAPIHKANLSYKDLVERERTVAKPTPRQDKILAFLAKFQDHPPLDMVAKFRLILEKIGMDEADFLGTHIRSSPLLTLEARQIYGAYLDEYIRQLTSLVVKGETQYRGMDLFGFVARLTK